MRDFFDFFDVSTSINLKFIVRIKASSRKIDDLDLNEFKTTIESLQFNSR